MMMIVITDDIYQLSLMMVIVFAPVDDGDGDR